MECQRWPKIEPINTPHNSPTRASYQTSIVSSFEYTPNLITFIRIHISVSQNLDPKHTSHLASQRGIYWKHARVKYLQDIAYILHHLHSTCIEFSSFSIVSTLEYLHQKLPHLITIIRMEYHRRCTSPLSLLLQPHIPITSAVSPTHLYSGLLSLYNTDNSTPFHIAGLNCKSQWPLLFNVQWYVHP